FDATPRANPTFANVTFVGVPGATTTPDTAVRLRRGTAGKLFNIVVGPGWANGGLILSDAATLTQFNANNLQLKSWFITQAAGATNAVRSNNTSFSIADFNDGSKGG